MFSAYDIKKIIPRTVLALIGANLSWSLMNIVINSVNVLGDSIQDIILAPFTSAGLTSIRLDGSAAPFMAIAAAVVATAGAGLIPVVGIAVSGLFGILFAIVIVVLRTVILHFMVIVAPLAIALSVFPQTEKIFKQWWEWFFKVLLMYPFIMAIFAISQVSAGIISTTSSGAYGAILDMAAIAIIILPYFAIGKTLSMAGGTIGKVAGFVNNKDKGFIDSTKKWDKNRVAANRSEAKVDRYAKDNFAARGANSVLRRVMNPRSLTSFNKQKRIAALQAGSGTGEASYAEQFKGGFEALSDDQKKLLANSGGTKKGAERYIQAQANKAYSDIYNTLVGDKKEGDDGYKEAVEAARIAAKKAKMAKEQSLQRDAHILTERVGGINKTSARVAFRSAAGSMSATEIDDASARLVTGGSTAWTQRSRVESDSLASSASDLAKKTFQQKHDEATQKLAAAQQSGDGELINFYSSQLDGLRAQATTGGDKYTGVTIDSTKGKIETDSSGFYTGKRSEARILAQDAAIQAAIGTIKREPGAIATQAARVGDAAKTAATSALGASIDVGVSKAANIIEGVPIVGGLEKTKGVVSNFRSGTEGGKEGFRDSIIGKK